MTEAPSGAILLAIGLFAAVLPAALIFGQIKTVPVAMPLQEVA
jgi:hypothetical protein